MTPELIVEEKPGIVSLKLNRPDQLNALSPELLLGLRTAIDDIGQRDDIGCVIIRGEGRSFCAGYDLKARERAREMLPPGFAAQTITALASLPQPVVAAIHGHCFTGGLELALAADIIVAAESARFADTHAKWGMRAAWGLTQRLPRRIGPGAAKDLMFTGRELSGLEAQQLGLANRCIPDASFDREVQSCADAIVERSGPAIRWIKDQVNSASHLSMAEALLYERDNRPSATTEADARLRNAGWKKD